MYKKLFLDWYSEFWHFAFALKICTNIKKSVNKKIYLNIIQCLWSFSWPLAVRPNSDRRLCAYMFFFSLFFFSFSLFFPPFLSVFIDKADSITQILRYGWCVSSEVKCSRIPVSFHKVLVGREVRAKHHLWLWIFLAISSTRFSQCLLHNICSQVRGSCCPHFTDGILRDRRNNAKCFKDI